MYFLNAAKPILIDLASAFIFLAVYELTHSLKLSILAAIGVGLAQIGWSLLRKLQVAPMQWASLALVLTMGGASLLTQDPRFIMLKPTLIDGVLALVMAQRGWLDRYLPAIVSQHVDARTRLRWARAWPALMVALGGANILVAVTMSFSFWLWYSSFVPLGCVIALFLVQYVTFRALIVRKLRVERAAGAD